jgi:hypothetical protein
LPKSSGEGMGSKVKKLLREMNVLCVLIPKKIEENAVVTGVLAGNWLFRKRKRN